LFSIIFIGMKILIKESAIEKLRELIKTKGVTYTINLVGGLNNLVKGGFNGDFKEFYKYTDYIPYDISSDGERMFIDKFLVDTFKLEENPHWSGREKTLGKFKFVSKNGGQFSFNAKVTGPIFAKNGQEFMQVVGMSGDSGFGYTSLTKKETLGKSFRGQIFKQIIEKYNLESYL